MKTLEHWNHNHWETRELGFKPDNLKQVFEPLKYKQCMFIPVFYSTVKSNVFKENGLLLL